MNNTQVLIKAYELKEKILDSSEYKNVKEKEKEMEEKCSMLLIKYNNLFNEYNQALRFEKYGSDVNVARQELAECKLELDNNQYVKEYREAYKEMEIKLKEIEKIIFEKIIEKKYIG